MSAICMMVIITPDFMNLFKTLSLILISGLAVSCSLVSSTVANLQEINFKKKFRLRETPPIIEVN